jgi:hypothetical protein
MLVKHLCLATLVAIMGCAASSASSSTREPTLPRKAVFLSAAEIADAKADNATIYDALARLRPNWLAAHGAGSMDVEVSQYAVVYVDGQKYGLLESLRSIPAYQVANVRYYDVTEAGATFGVRAGVGGVIAVKMK